MGKDANTDMELISKWLKVSIKEFHSLHSKEWILRREGADDSQLARLLAPQSSFCQQASPQ